MISHYLLVTKQEMVGPRDDMQYFGFRQCTDITAQQFGRTNGIARAGDKALGTVKVAQINVVRLLIGKATAAQARTRSSRVAPRAPIQAPKE